MNEKFQSLVETLEGHFDKSYSDLLDDTKQRINKHWFPFGQFGDENIPADMWDSSSPEGRRDTAYQYDYQNDPKFEPERQHQENLLGQQWELEDKIRSLQQMNPQTPLEYESKERQLAEAKAELEQINRELDLPAPLPENTRQNQESDPTGSQPGQSRREQQIAYLLQAIKAAGYDPQKIPYGGKNKLMDQCCKEQPSLFTESGFKHAWKEAKRGRLVEVDNPEQYR